MARRPKYSRWRRLPGLYRTGELKPADPDQELERLTLYVPWAALDEADQQAARHGFASAQDYCTELLLQALDAERVREQVAEVEARRGPLDGLNEIADDPALLAELSNTVVPNPRPRPVSPPAPADESRRTPPEFEPEHPTPWITGLEPVAPPAGPAIRIPAPSPALGPMRGDRLSPAALVVLRHAGQSHDDDRFSFLASLRRGEAVPPNEVAELAQALHQLEVEYQESKAMDRRLTFALHRLAFESQILHTDAWPGTFDAWTVDMLRAVQEAVERILSGEDIRYGPGPVRSGEVES